MSFDFYLKLSQIEQNMHISNYSLPKDLYSYKESSKDSNLKISIKDHIWNPLGSTCIC